MIDEPLNHDRTDATGSTLTIVQNASFTGYVETYTLSILAAYMVSGTNTESSVIYTWNASPSTNVNFSSNGQNASKNTTVTIINPGSYTLTCTATAGGLTATSSVTIVAGLNVVFDPVVSACNVNTSICAAFSSVFAGSSTWSVNPISGNSVGGQGGGPLPPTPNNNFGISPQVNVSGTNGSFGAAFYSFVYDQNGNDITERSCNSFNLTQQYTGLNSTLRFLNVLQDPTNSYAAIGSVSTTISQSGNTLTFNIVMDNTSSNYTFTSWQYRLMNFVFDSVIASNVESTNETPNPAYMLYEKGLIVATTTTLDKPWRVHFYMGGNASGNVGQLQICSDDSNEFQIQQLGQVACDPIGPGQNDTVTLVVEFADPDINNIGLSLRVAQLCPSFYSQYAAKYPSMLNYTDRRPLKEAFFDTSSTPQAAPWYADYTNLTNLEGFRTAMLNDAAEIIQNIKTEGSAGVITWDIDSTFYPDPYYGDPREATTIMPALAYQHTPGGPQVIDEFYAALRYGGIRFGYGLRAQQLHFDPANPTGLYHTEYDSAPDAVTDIIAKAKYARNRWGCTLFYLDSSVYLGGFVTNNQGYAPDYMRQICAALPDCVFFPEWKNPAFYQFCIPYNELRGGFSGTDPAIRLVYPDASSYIWVGDNGSYPGIDAQAAEYIPPVEAGDILSSHAQDTSLQAFYDALPTPVTNTNILIVDVGNPVTITSQPENMLNLSVLGLYFVNYVSEEPSVTYTWSCSPAGINFTTNNSNSAKNTTATVTASGNYTVTVTLSAGGQTATSSSMISVNVVNVSSLVLSPITYTRSTLSADLSVLGTYLVNNVDEENQVVYTWLCQGVSFSDSGTNTAKNTTATFAQAGIYTISLTATAGSLTQTSSISISVSPPPASDNPINQSELDSLIAAFGGTVVPGAEKCLQCNPQYCIGNINVKGAYVPPLTFCNKYYGLLK